MKTIHTDKAPKPSGHYSQAIVHSGIVYVAGQVPRDPNNPSAPAGSIEQQTEQTLKNVAVILEAAGSSLSQVLVMTVYISDMALWGKVNEVCTRMMGDHKPARAVVPVKELHYGYQVEIQAIATVRR